MLVLILFAILTICSCGQEILPTKNDPNSTMENILDHVTVLKQTTVDRQTKLLDPRISAATDVVSLKNEVSSFKNVLQSTTEELLATKEDVEQLRRENKRLSSRLDKLMLNLKRQELVKNKASTGNVVKFQVKLRNHTYVQYGSTLRFDTVMYNTYQAYNATSGIYTAPVAGTYNFWANVVMYGDDAFMQILLAHNNTFVAGGIASTGPHATSPIDTASINTVFYLKKGEQIRFEKGGGMEQYIFGTFFSSYGGALLSACQSCIVEN